MTISSTTRKAGPFIGNGVTTDFPFDFKLFEAADLRVVHADALGVETDLVHVTDCTVTLNADQDENPGGSVVLNAPLVAGDRLVLLSAVPELQPVDLTNQGGFYPELVNGGLDRATVLSQQLREQLGRSITLPVTAEPGDLALPAPVPGQLLGWTNSGLTNFDPSSLVSVVAYGSTIVDVFTFDGVQTSFSLSESPGAQNNLRVSIDGVVQLPGEDFIWPGGTTLTFAVAPPAGTKGQVQYQRALANVPDVSDMAGRGAQNLLDIPNWLSQLGSAAVSATLFGAAGDGIADDTAELLLVFDFARDNGFAVDGMGKTYGVNFGFLNGSGGLEPNVALRNFVFKDLTPDQTGGVSRTLQFSGAGPASADWVWLENIRVDRNGGTIDTVLHPNVGFEVSNLGKAHVEGAEVYGNNAGELFRAERIGLLTGSVYVHDGFYVHTSQTNDTVEGAVLVDIETAFFAAKVARLGRTDRTTVERSRYSRGVTLDRVRNGVIQAHVEQVDQGVDFSGYGSTRAKVTGVVRHCFNNGVKLAHAHYRDNISGLNIEHCGRYGVVIGGPTDTEGQPYQQQVRVSGLVISETGSNGYYKGIASTTMGIALDRNSSDPLRASFPKDVVVEGNVIASHVGSVVVSRTGGDLTMADGSFPVTKGKPVTFTSAGTLPTGLTAGVTYWLGWDELGLTVRVATSYINALDGVFLTLSGGSGVHTMAGKSFMDYGGFVDGAAVKDRAAPNWFRNNVVRGATVSASAGFAGTFAYVPTDAGQTLADNTWTDVIPNGNSPGGDFIVKVDPGALYNASTGVFTLAEGLWDVSGVVAFSPNATGIRDSRLVLDIGSGYKSLWAPRRLLPPNGADPADVPVSECVRVPAGGATLKVQARQSIGGGTLNTHVNTRISVARVGGAE